MKQNLQYRLNARKKFNLASFSIYRPSGNDTGLFSGIPQDANYRISLSKKLQAGITENGESYSQIPIFNDDTCIKLDKDSKNAIVYMEGISHYIVYGFNEIRNMSENEIKLYARETMARKKIDQGLCCGVIYVDKSKDKITIHPIVYVKKADTLYYETACGSGTAALGLLLAKRRKRSIKNIPIYQPSGLPIKISVDYDGKNFNYAQIQSSIEKLNEGTLVFDTSGKVSIC